MKRTHCGEIINQLIENAPDITGYNMHYIFDGIQSNIIDKYDGQEYIVTVKPVKDVIEKEKYPKIVAEFPSKSNPESYHTVKEYVDGTHSCSCIGYCVHGHCWHVDKVEVENGKV
jgi:hypothetical protein